MWTELEQLLDEDEGRDLTTPKDKITAINTVMTERGDVA